MKYLIRYCCVFFCLVSLLIGFSVTASADEVETNSTKIVQDTYFIYGNAYKPLINYTFYPNDGEETHLYYHENISTTYLTNNAQYYSVYTVTYPNDSVILKANKNYTVSLNNIYFSSLVEGDPTFYVRDHIDLYLNGLTSEGEYISVTNLQVQHVKGTPIYNISFDISPKKDVSKLQFGISASIDPSKIVSGNTYKFYSYVGEWNGDDKFQFSLEVESQESGLLKTVIEWLKGIKNGITDMFNSIAELPSKLWTLIENGLKDLFVPNENYMVDYKEDWDLLLSQRFGAVYEVCDLVTDIVGTFNTYDETDTIELPITTIELPDNNSFTFGGYSVPIVPNGFEHIANLLKIVTGIVCTLAFLNGMLKRYDELMGVEQ